jgi:hypothetical protein
MIGQRDMFGRMGVDIFIYNCVLCFVMYIERCSENTRESSEI